MIKMTAGLALLVFSQISFGAVAFTCKTPDNKVQLEISHGRVANVKLQQNGKVTDLLGNWTVEQDFYYSMNSYALIDKAGQKADLIVSTKEYMSRGGGCRTRNCDMGAINYKIISAKLNYNSKETFFNCQ
jgi:hypothetical protein